MHIYIEYQTFFKYLNGDFTICQHFAVLRLSLFFSSKTGIHHLINFLLVINVPYENNIMLEMCIKMKLHTNCLLFVCLFVLFVVILEWGETLQTNKHTVYQMTFRTSKESVITNVL